MRTLFFTILCMTLFYSCTQTSHSFIEKAGENRNEVQKVIDHYTHTDNNPLKLKAALFLLSNMEGHYSLNNNLYKDYLQALDSLNLPTGMYQVGRMIPLIGSQPLFNSLEQEDDLANITSSYLIHHIDYIFKLWKTEPWLQDVCFEDLCEYLLPYRIENESLINWETSSNELKTHFYPFLHNYDDVKYSTSNINRELIKMCHKYVKFEYSNPKINLPIIGQYKLGCYEQALLDLVIYRMAGIPSSIDCIPCWGDADGKHYWAEPITYEKKQNSNIFIFNRKFPKVYRRVFSTHTKFTNEEIEQYQLFNVSYPYLVDVTEEYTQCYDVDVKYKRRPQDGYQYLAVFNNQKWQPVACGQKSHYSKMGANILYLPICINPENGKEQILSHPFVLQKQGKIQTLIPDTNRLQQLVLYRKYPYESRKSFYNSSSKGTLFCGSNDEGFASCDTLYQITSDIKMDIHRIAVTPQKKYRYVRICPLTTIALSELKLFGDKELNIAGYKTSSPYNLPDRIFDNDWLTYTVLNKDLTIDLGEEQELRKIVFQGRNDGNNIVSGDNYELFYMSLDGWKSCGDKVAVTDSIIFDNVPSNALYWLHNKTKGKEERIFTMDGKQQRFW